MKPTIYLDIDDPFLNQGYVNVFPNKYYKIKGIEFDSFKSSNIVGKIHLSDVVINLIENYIDKFQWILLCPYHIFDIADEYTIDKINELDIVILNDADSINGIKIATDSRNIIDDIRCCKILFNENLQMEYVYDTTNIENMYLVNTFDDLIQILDFFAKNQEFINVN